MPKGYKKTRFPLMTVKKAVYAGAAVLVAALALALPRPLLAIGEFSVGINAGVTYAPNNIDLDINQYNTAMKYYSENTAGTQKVTQMSVPYSPVIGFNARYQLNYVLLRMGCHYSNPIMPVEGSITPVGGVKNSIRIKTYQASLPVTIGLMIPLKKRTYFYLGAGGTFHQAYLEITQDHPVQPAAVPAFDMATLNLSNNTRDRYYKAFVGYHMILGAEVPLSEKSTISAEWIHQEGRSSPIGNEGRDASGNDTSLPKKEISVQGDILLFGVNYYIPI